MTTDAELLLDLSERVLHRYYGKYRGIVTDVDPATLRVKATVPAVLGTAESGWCVPCVPYAGPNVGFFFVPAKGASVWIEFEGGDVSLPIWTGCFWLAGQLPSDAAPQVRGVVTSASHKLLFDDDGESITLADPNDNQLGMDASGITQARGAQKVVVGDASVSINDGAMEVS